MSDSAHRPSAEELQELLAIVRRDPGSPAFVDLGDAYIALGRPREAVEVGARGLKTAPDNLEGRLMVSRAFVSLHQWKQAQAELLKVVKTDRNHAGGFTLLGEVLMRRADYERALPVLQHAQNLDPANPRVLSLLKRARHGQPLDPPAPIPTPQSPAQSAQPPLPRSAGAALDDEPTRVADDRSPASVSIDDPLLRADATESDADTNQVVSPEAVASDGSIRQRLPLPSQRGGDRPPPVPDRGVGGTREPPARPQVRPRVLPAEKPKDAAQESLRRSAAVGENYLNGLLTGGLLDVPNVRTPPDDDWNARAGKRWVRKLIRGMAVMLVLLGLGLGGGGYWYWYTTQQREQDVARHLEQTELLVATTAYDGLEHAKEQVRKAADRDASSLRAITAFAMVGALQAYLYGTDPKDAELSMTTASKEIAAGDEGWRDLLVARVALVLTRLPDIEKPVDRLADIREELDTWLEAHPDDHLVRWLQGEAILAVGNRTDAHAAFEEAGADGAGPPVAAVARANMLLDEGRHDEALELYDEALARTEARYQKVHEGREQPEGREVPDGHPLALLGRALVRAELGSESDEAMRDLNVGLSDDKGPRVAAYKKLALAYTRYADEYYEDFAESLDEAAALAVSEPRYRARVALGRALQGRIDEANDVRQTIEWYGSDKPQPHPLVAVLDAELILASGLPESALERLGQVGGPWADRVRGRAQFELGEYDAAIETLEAALKGAPEETEERSAQQLMLSGWLDAARFASGKGKARGQADERLTKLGRFTRTKASRVIHGVALLKQGRTEAARERFEQSLDDITEAAPNPLAYRAHTELARIALGAEEVDRAVEHVREALELNERYLPAHGLMGRVALLRGKPGTALGPLEKALAEPAAAEVDTELAYAEALVTQKGAGDAERAGAIEAVERAVDKGAEGEALERVVVAIDDAELAEELDMDLERLKKKLRRRGR